MATRREAANAALEAAFPHTAPILAGFPFPGATCGVFTVSQCLPWRMPTVPPVIVLARR